MTGNEITRRIETSGLQSEIGSIFELELGQPPKIAGDDYRIKPDGAQLFAMDGSGGMFAVLPDGRILLIDSEGSFGIVASDFNEMVAIATGLPSWRDALRFVGEPDLAKARADWAAYVEQWKLDDGQDKPWPYGSDGYSVATPGAARQIIRSRLNVEPSSDPFAVLHRAVNKLSGDVAVLWQEEPLMLFGPRL